MVLCVAVALYNNGCFISPLYIEAIKINACVTKYRRICELIVDGILHMLPQLNCAMKWIHRSGFIKYSNCISLS
jgi:hypothetical protein